MYEICTKKTEDLNAEYLPDSFSLKDMKDNVEKHLLF